MSRGRKGERIPWTVVWKADNRRWAVRYYDPNGKRKDEYVPKDVAAVPEDRVAAEKYGAKWFKSFERETRILKSSKPGQGTPKVLTITQLSSKWLALRKQRLSRRQIKPATYRQDAGHMEEHILPVLGSIPADSLAPTAVREFVGRLVDKGLAPNTVHNVASVLRTFLDDALAENWVSLPGNPARHPGVQSELPKKAKQHRIAYLSANQISTLIKSPKTPVERRFRYLLGVLTGLRDGEVSGLRFNSITDEDGSGPTIHVDEALALVSIGKGYGFQAPKTEDSVRLVPVHGLLGEALGWWRSTGWTIWVGRKAKDSDVIFPNEKGKPWRPRSAEHLRTDLAAAGLATTFGTGKRAKDITFHVLRATFATLLADAEVEPSLRSILLVSATTRLPLCAGYVPRSIA